MIRKKHIGAFSIILIAAAAIAALLLWGYSLSYETVSEIYDGHKIIFTEDDEYYKGTSSTRISENGGKVSCKGGGAYADGKTVYITEGGTYTLSGNFSNVLVKSSDRAPVVLKMENAYIESRSDAPIYAYKTSKLIISSAEDSENYIIDGRGKYSDSETKSAIYSKADITLNGEGKTIIQGNSKDAVASKGTIKVVSGNWDISSDSNGIDGAVIFIRGGRLNCSSQSDTLKSDEKKNEGLIVLKGGDVKLNSQGDAIYSSGNVYLDGTDVNIETDSVGTADKEAPSTKGIKADKGIFVNGGKLETDTYDDALHAAEEIRISGGELTIASGDDAIHCDKDVYISDTVLNITDCYEGIEGACIEINSGDIRIKAQDDGINAADGTAVQMPPGGGAPGGNTLPAGEPVGGSPGGNTPPDMQGNQAPPAENGGEETSLPLMLVINGGKIYIEADGDGIDINGSAEVNGGEIETYCMKDGPEEAFDTDGGLSFNGGTLFGAGNSNMFVPPNEDSKQNNLICYPDQTYRNGGEVVIKNSDGEEIENRSLKGSFGIILAYGEKIKSGETYTVLIDGKEIGSAKVSGVNTIIKAEGADDRPGGSGGAPPMDANGRPQEPPGGGPGGGMNGAGERPPEPPNGEMGGMPGKDGQSRDKGESVRGADGGDMPGGAPPMDENGKPLDPPPEKTGNAEKMGESDTESTENINVSQNIGNALQVLLTSLLAVIMGCVILKLIKRKF